jgi:hypothetical protein
MPGSTSNAVTIQKAYDALAKTTRAAPLKSKELAQLLGISDADGHPQTRQIITDVMEQKDLPLGASGDGFYVIQDESELNDYLRALDIRVIGTINRKALVTGAFRRSKGLPTQPETADVAPDDSDDPES